MLEVQITILIHAEVKRPVSDYLFHGCHEHWSLSVCQFEQFMVESHGDEALQGRPEVMGISAQSLHQLPAQSHCLHTEGLVIMY